MDMAVKPRLGIGRRIGPDVARVAVRQIKGKEVCFLLDAADYNKHFTKIGLCMTGRMAQRHEHLLAGPLPVSNVILDDGVAAIKTALVPQPLENTLCSVTLLARAAPVFSKPLVHLACERIQLRAPDRRCPPISRRLRIGQHLRNTVPADPKIPGNLASAQSILEMSVTHLQIQIHGVYPQALPKSERAKVDDFYAARDTTTVPLPWPSIAPPFTASAPALTMNDAGEGRLVSVSGDEGSWGSLISAVAENDDSEQDSVEYVETRIENTTSIVLALRESQRLSLFEDVVVVLQSDRPLADILSDSEFSDEAVVRIATAAERLLGQSGPMIAASTVALRVHRDLDGLHLLQMSL